MQTSRDCCNLQEIQGEASVIYLNVKEYIRFHEVSHLDCYSGALWLVPYLI